MRRPVRKIMLCVLMLACVVATAAAQEDPPPKPRAVAEQDPAAWKKLAPTGGGFTILMPGTAAEQTTPVQAPAGKLENHLFTLETSLAAYIVSYVNFPEPVSDPAAIKFMLDSGRDQGLANARATLKSEKEIKIGKHFGREWVMEVQGKYVARARAYWVERRLYQALIIMDVAPGATPDLLRQREDATAKFFNSFALTGDVAGAM